MAYYSETKLREMNFKSLGVNVKISDRASFYDCHRIELGDNSRVDDYCVISGNVVIKSYCHITPMCLIAGGEPGIFIEDFCTLAYGVKVFAQSDDYSGKTMTNSLIPQEYKSEIFKPVYLDRHVIIGAGSVVFPGVKIAEGCSVGAMTMVNKSTEPWGVYIGVPAKRVKNRSRDLLNLEQKFQKAKYDSI